MKTRSAFLFRKTYILLIFIYFSGLLEAQSLSYDTTFTGASGAAWNAKVKLPPTYYTNPTDSFQCIIFFPGVGEQGTNISLLAVNGPHAYMASGWDGGVTLGNGVYYPIIISLQPPGNSQPSLVKPKIDAILSRYRIKRNSLHLTGLSMGGWTANLFVTYQPTAGDYSYGSMIRSMVNVEGVRPDDTYGATPAYATRFRYWALTGGREAGFEQINDSRDIKTIIDTLNAVTPGKSYFQYTNFGGGGHCCWSNWYGPGLQTFVINGVNQTIYQWMLRQGDTSINSIPAVNQAPVANAGYDQVITLPLSTITLNGSGTDADGTVTSYQWTKISGPSTFSILSATQATTIINTLIQGTYAFELKVTDNQGAVGRDTVQVTVNGLLNQPPVANAGNDQSITLPINTLTLTGSGTDPDGTIASYQWTKISGPSTFSIVSPATASTVVNNLIQGTYTFQLKVTDNSGAAATSTIQVVVNNAVTPPPTLPGSIIMGLGEYQSFIINSSGKLFGISSSKSAVGAGVAGGSAVPPVPVSVPDSLTFLTVASGLHHSLAVDNHGEVWTWGWNEVGQAGNGDTSSTAIYQPYKITQDKNGNPFKNVIQVAAYHSYNTYNGNVALKSDGTVWIWGNTGGGMIGNGSVGQIETRPVQIVIPGNRSITKIIAAEVVLALATDGTVWSWGGGGFRMENLGRGTITNVDYKTPGQVVGLPTNIIDIAGANSYYYALTTTGVLYGWGWLGSYLGRNESYTNNTPISTPLNLTSIFNLPHPVSSIACNTVATHVILTDSTLWGWGDNAQGTVGTGSELNFANYSPAYAWSMAPGELLQKTPVQIIPSVHNFSKIFSGTAYVFYSYALTSDGKLYSWGRNKGGVLGNGVVCSCSSVAATYPNSWDVPLPSIVDPLALVQSFDTPSPYCLANPLTSPCNTCSVSPNTPPVANAGSDKTITLPTNSVTLNGSGTDAGGTIASYQWTKLTGPTTFTVVTPTQASTVVNNLVQGVYTFELKVTDNLGAIDRDTVQVTVNSSTPTNQSPVANAGSDKTITLPTNTLTLSGSGTDADGTIASYQWTKIAGPTSFTIVSATQASTVVNNLVQGVYTFELRVTDNQGAIGRDTVQVTVNAAPPTNQPPVANAGSDKTITLPTNSVTLNGTGTDADGTIASYQWSKIAGPSLFTILSPTQSTTSINSLVQGVYSFELIVTDNQGATGRDTVIVTVNAAVTPPANQPPVANAGIDQSITLPLNSTSLSGSGTDADGTITSYQWTMISGPGQSTIVNSNQPITDVSGLTEGLYKFELKVTDNMGASGRDTVEVLVNADTRLQSTAQLYPNPAVNFVNIKIDAITNSSNTNLWIYDERGTLVYEEQFVRSQQVMMKQIDVSKFSKGVYFIVLDVDINNRQSLKFIKQ